jgi:hypothetical protein
MPKGQSYFETNFLFANCERCKTSRSFSCKKESDSYFKRHAKFCKAITVPASLECDATLPGQFKIIQLNF